MAAPLRLHRASLKTSRAPDHAGCLTAGHQAMLRRDRGPLEFMVAVGHIDADCCRVYARQERPGNDYHLGLLVAFPKSPMVIAIDGKKTVIPPGRYRVVNPQEASTFVPEAGFAGVEIGLSQSMLRECREAVGMPKGAGPFDFDPQPRAPSKTLRSLVDLLGHYVSLPPHPHHDAWLPLIMYGAGLQLLANVFWTHPSALRDRLSQWGYRHGLDPRIEKVLEVIREHFAEPVTVAQLARWSGLSASSLFRLFEQEFQSTPLEFLRRYRLEQAERLIAATPQPNLADIACRVGYASTWALRKSFRLVHGMAPTF